MVSHVSASNQRRKWETIKLPAKLHNTGLLWLHASTMKNIVGVLLDWIPTCQGKSITIFRQDFGFKAYQFQWRFQVWDLIQTNHFVHQHNFGLSFHPQCQCESYTVIWPLRYVHFIFWCRSFLQWMTHVQHFSSHSSQKIRHEWNSNGFSWYFLCILVSYNMVQHDFYLKNFGDAVGCCSTEDNGPIRLFSLRSWAGQLRQVSWRDVTLDA